MLKTVTIAALMFCLCSCEIFGWDSAGGNNGDLVPKIGDGEAQIGVANLYYIDIPMAYPNTGSVTPVDSGEGLQVTIPDFEEQPESVVISEENALILTRAACDETATSLLNISSQEAEVIITWQNASMAMGSLSVTKAAVGEPPLQVITCIN